MDCPSCGAGMSPLVVGDVVLDECPRCGGQWYDALELQMLEKSGSRDDAALQRLLEEARADDRRAEPLCCPRCGTRMQRHPHSIKSGVDLDECYACGGIWLDQGELGAIRRNFHTEAERDRLFEELLKGSPMAHKGKSPLQRISKLV